MDIDMQIKTIEYAVVYLVEKVEKYHNSIDALLKSSDNIETHQIKTKRKYLDQYMNDLKSIMTEHKRLIELKEKGE